MQYTTAPVLFAVKRCTHAGSRRNPTMESYPPTRHSKKTVCDTRLTKCIFVPKNALCQHLFAAEGAFGKLFFGPNGPILAVFAVLWLHKVSKTAWQNPQNQPKMRQNHPKMDFGGILDRLEAISIPSISISKGIKNKNFDRIWVPRCPFWP